MSRCSLQVLRHGSDIVEYRVYPKKSTSRWKLVALLFFAAGTSYVVSIGMKNLVAFTLLATFAVWKIGLSVLHESVLVLTSQGVQLETHRGIPHFFFFPPFTLSVDRRFFALHKIKNFIMHEGLDPFTTRYYAAVMVESSENPEQPVVIHVAYKNLLPHGTILREVYQGVRESMRPRPDLVSEELTRNG